MEKKDLEQIKKVVETSVGKRFVVLQKGIDTSLDKRFVESRKDLETSVDKRLVVLQKNIETSVGKRFVVLQKNIETSLDKRFVVFRKDIDSSIEKHLASVHEEISDLRSELKADIKGVDDRLISVESKLGGIDNRIDNETFARRDLETRVRIVLPQLPHPQEQ